MGPITWADAEAPGVGNLRWRNWDWVMLDYRDRLTLPDDMQSVLKRGQAAVEDPAVELRECAILNAAAVVLQHQLGRRPASSEVQELALDFRRALLHEAVAAEGAVGDLPAMMTQAECDVRTYIHDLVYRDHDKDYRMCAAFPLKAMEHLARAVVRVDYYGNAATETISGAKFDKSPGNVVWVLIHKGT